MGRKQEPEEDLPFSCPGRFEGLDKTAQDHRGPGETPDWAQEEVAVKKGVSGRN